MLSNWVAETSTTTGSGASITLAAALAGRLRFGAVLTNNEPVPYHLVTGNGDRESGIAIYNNNTLTRVMLSEQIVSGVAVAAPTTMLALTGTTVIMLGGQLETSEIKPPPPIRHAANSTWLSPSNYSSTVSSQAVPANELTWAPYLINAPVRIDQIRLTVVTAGAAGSVARIAIDSYAAPGASSTRLYETAAIDIATTGTKVETIASPLTLRAGWYWVGYIASAAHNVRAFNNPISTPISVDGNGTPTSTGFSTETAGWSVVPARNIIDSQRRYYAPAVHFRVAA